MKAALIGLGMVSDTYADAFRNSERVELSRVCARTSESQQAFLNKFPDLTAQPTENIAEIAADPDIDFVVVATPPNSRAEIVDTLLRANKPILMEKPVERTLQSAAQIILACEENGVPLGIVLQHRARPMAAKLQEVVKNLGPLLAVEVNIPWWRPQSYYDDANHGSLAHEGGGVLINQALHTLDLMLMLTGPVSEATAMCTTTAFHSMEGEDFVVAGLQFNSGAVGQLFATTASFPGRNETITIHCSTGSVKFEAGHLQVHHHDGRIENFGQTVSTDPKTNSDCHQMVIEDFADAITEGRDPLVTGRSAFEVHKLITALEVSAKNGSKVVLKEGEA